MALLRTPMCRSWCGYSATCFHITLGNCGTNQVQPQHASDAHDHQHHPFKNVTVCMQRIPASGKQLLATTT